MPHFSHDGVDIFYETHGEGPTVLLIPGLAADSQSWLPILPGLSSCFRVIAVDNRGCGRTTPMDAPNSIVEMADDCAALVASCGLRSVGVIGYSMGGFVAQAMALRHPDVVGKLVLTATSSVSSRRNNVMFADWAAALENGAALRPWFRNLFYWVFSARFFDDDAAVENFLRLSVEYPYPQTPRAFRNQVEAIAAFDGTGNLGRIKARTLVLTGGEDLLFSTDVCAAFAASLPDAAFSVVDGAGHAIYAEKPEAFLQFVLPFLSSR
jgi:pimeloyl-ACP methyl ester carboxylesterase